MKVLNELYSVNQMGCLALEQAVGSSIWQLVAIVTSATELSWGWGQCMVPIGGVSTHLFFHALIFKPEWAKKPTFSQKDPFSAVPAKSSFIWGIIARDHPRPRSPAQLTPISKPETPKLMAMNKACLVPLICACWKGFMVQGFASVFGLIYLFETKAGVLKGSTES